MVKVGLKQLFVELDLSDGDGVTQSWEGLACQLPNRDDVTRLGDLDHLGLP
jgi:hypothetical protein